MRRQSVLLTHVGQIVTVSPEDIGIEAAVLGLRVTVFDDRNAL